MKRSMVLVLGAVLALTACSAGDKVVAKAGRAKVTVKNFQERLNDSPPAYRSFLSTDAGKKQFLDLIVREKLVLEAARKAGTGRKEDFKKMLTRFKQDQAKRLKEYEEGMLVELYIRDLYEKELSATEAETNKYYEENIKDYTKPVEVTARHILLSTKEEAEKALARVKSGEDFAKVAKEMSSDYASAMQGGKIGPFRKGELVPEFEKAVFALPQGKTSDIVQTQFGYHIVQKISTKSLPAAGEEQAKSDIKKLLEKVKFDNWIENAKKKFNVKVNYDLIKDIQPEAAQMPMQMMGQQDQGR